MAKSQLDKIEALLLMQSSCPQWISAKDTAKWLGVDEVTLFRWRSSKGLAWTNINGKTVMYDKKQIEKMLFENSTYAFQNKEW
jgi:hypothetical protein